MRKDNTNYEKATLKKAEQKSNDYMKYLEVYTNRLDEILKMIY